MESQREKIIDISSLSRVETQAFHDMALDVKSPEADDNFIQTVRDLIKEQEEALRSLIKKQEETLQSLLKGEDKKWKNLPNDKKAVIQRGLEADIVESKKLLDNDPQLNELRELLDPPNISDVMRKAGSYIEKYPIKEEREKLLITVGYADLGDKAQKALLEYAKTVGIDIDIEVKHWLSKVELNTGALFKDIDLDEYGGVLCWILGGKRNIVVATDHEDHYGALLLNKELADLSFAYVLDGSAYTNEHKFCSDGLTDALGKFVQKNHLDSFLKAAVIKEATVKVADEEKTKQLGFEFDGEIGVFRMRGMLQDVSNRHLSKKINDAMNQRFRNTVISSKKEITTQQYSVAIIKQLSALTEQHRKCIHDKDFKKANQLYKNYINLLTEVTKKENYFSNDQKINLLREINQSFQKFQQEVKDKKFSKAQTKAIGKVQEVFVSLTNTINPLERNAIKDIAKAKNSIVNFGKKRGLLLKTSTRRDIDKLIKNIPQDKNLKKISLKEKITNLQHKAEDQLHQWQHKKQITKWEKAWKNSSGASPLNKAKDLLNQFARSGAYEYKVMNFFKSQKPHAKELKKLLESIYGFSSSSADSKEIAKPKSVDELARLIKEKIQPREGSELHNILELIENKSRHDLSWGKSELHEPPVPKIKI